ncbi:MAG: hypothetical protein ABJF50_05710 [Paracoccaceae bacterium]
MTPINARIALGRSDMVDQGRECIKSSLHRPENSDYVPKARLIFECATSFLPLLHF